MASTLAHRSAFWARAGVFVLAVLCSSLPSAADEPPVKKLILPGESFLIDDRPAFVLLPAEQKRRTPQPWIMYAPTLPAYPDSHERWMHEQFLAAGVAVAGIDTGEAYGSPLGQKRMSALYTELTEKRGFATRPCLLGRSRGGLWASSWAIAHPDRVAGLAGIYPVFDLRTYPGLAKAAPAYGMTPEALEANLDKHNPIARVDVLAKAQIPVCIIHGDDDKVVPLKENSATLADRYEDLGAGEAVELIVAEGQGHNFWEGFFRCQRLVDFAIARAKAAAVEEGAAKGDSRVRFPGQRSEWNGFDRYDFEVDGKPVLVVAPRRPAPGRPWVWHGEFFGHRPGPDIALLKRGFHIAYMRVPDMLGAPSAVAHWDAFYRELTETYGLAAKPALVGLSRGGLYCYNWAAANPTRVACIYGDAPVCDFKSWPGGKGSGPGSPRDWQLVLERYGFADEAEALAYEKNPVDNLAPLARAGVPLLHVYGDADEVVPWQENTGCVAERYRGLGGSIRLIVKPGIGHHPHGLDDPAPIVEFVVQHASLEPPAAKPPRDPVDELAATLEPTRQVVYKKVADRELSLDVFDPQGLQPGERRPCFLIIHGGGWAGGEPRRMYPFAAHFARLGMVGISVQYRLLNAATGTTVFDCVEDGRTAVRFVRSHAASLGVDPEKIVVSGGSAGGHVAVGTALFHGIDSADEASDVSPIPNALVLLFPVIDTSPEGYGNTKIGTRWRELSPAHRVQGQVPPTLIFHGSADTVTPLAGAQAFCEAMHREGNRCELVIDQGGVHGYLMRDRQKYRETLRRSEAFLESLGLLPHR